MELFKPTKAEPYPNGKKLFLASMLAKNREIEEAEEHWKLWEGDFMTKREWERTAELFTKAMTLETKLGRTTK